MSYEILFSCKRPWLLEVASQIPQEIFEKSIILDARKMETFDDFNDELEKKFRFPEYYGRNFNALRDFLHDLSWLSRKYYIVIINHSSHLLCREDIGLFDGFLTILKDMAEEWSKPVEIGEIWDRPSIPFHVLFETSPSSRDSFLKKLAEVNFYLPIIELKT